MTDAPYTTRTTVNKDEFRDKLAGEWCNEHNRNVEECIDDLYNSKTVIWDEKLTNCAVTIEQFIDYAEEKAHVLGGLKQTK